MPRAGFRLDGNRIFPNLYQLFERQVNWQNTRVFKTNRQQDIYQVADVVRATSTIRGFLGASEQLDKMLGYYVRNILVNQKLRSSIANMHKDLALEARDEVVKKFVNSKIYRNGKKSYRYNDRDPRLARDSNKRLLNALKRDDLFIADATGIGLINVEMLDQQARQWYRLNFGAMPKGKGQVVGQKAFQMFGESSKAPITLDRFGPSKPFFVPQSYVRYGYWSDKALPAHPNSVDASVWTKLLGESGKGQYLYLTPFSLGPGSFGAVLSKGIKATRFLDAGVTLINDEYGRRMQNLILDHEQTGRRATRNFIKF